MKNAISLFTGCGGSDLGVRNAGFRVVMANDVLTYAKDVYLANHAEVDFVLGSVEKIVSFPSAELLVGCYPCQGFSQGGVRDPSRRINTLYREFARALTTVKPRAFVVENVSGMARANYSHLLNDQFKVFTEAGYRVKATILNAANYGVAQSRKRIFFVGIQNAIGAEYSFPPPTHGIPDGAPLVRVKDALKYMRHWPEGEFYDEAFHWYYMSRDRRCDWDDLAKTIVANPRHVPLHPISPKLVRAGRDKWRFESDAPARRFSYKEAARLQGFPSSYRFPDTESGSLNMKYKVVGNAVPPPLFEAVVKAIPNSVWR
jgi:DNA (cytosine-5)-methyltransferase 1